METKINEKIFVGGGKSEVLLDEATNEVSIKGVNVVTDQPGIGDILCYDENRKYKFIQLDTFHAGTFPAAWETLGVVVLRKGNTVTICSKHNETKKFMEVFPYIVTGQVLDGAEHTAQLRLHGKPSTTTYYEFKYTASTVDECVSQLQQFLLTNGETDWSAYKDAQDRVILQYDNYTSSEYVTTSITMATGLTLTSQVSADCPQQPKFKLKCGIIGFGICNIEKAKVFFKEDISYSSFNPATDIDSIPEFPVCWPAFAGTSKYQSDHCLWLRQKYCTDPAHPKVEEWEAYIEDTTLVLPCMFAGQSPKWRDGAVLSAYLKGITYRATDGTQKPLYPAVEYCSQFFGGQGYLPSMAELIESFGNVTYGLAGVTRDKADAINRSLYAIGGDAVACNRSLLTSGRYSSMHAWYVSGNGYLDGSAFFSNPSCAPLARIKLPVD